MKSKPQKIIYDAIRNYFKKGHFKGFSLWRVPIGGSFYDEKETSAVMECYLEGWLSTQKKVIEFEKRFSNYIGVRHGVATNSGSSANLLALKALMEAGDLKPGDEIIVPATTFVTVVSPIVQLKLIPVFVDVDNETLNISPKEIQKAVNPGKTKAIMVVHTLGHPAEMDEIMKIAKNKKLKVIEDCCEAHGAKYKNKKVGSFGDLATFSFYVAHNMTTAEGGMVLTNSDDYHRLVSELREFGRLKSYKGNRFGYSDEKLKDYDERYVFHKIGYNFRMADTPAAFGIEQLKKLDKLNKKRIKNAQFLKASFNKKFSDFFQIPLLESKNIFHVFYGFPVIIKNNRIQRVKVVRFLESKGIEVRAIFCSSLPDQPCFRNIKSRTVGSLPVSRLLQKNAFFIGCHPGLDRKDLLYVIETLNKFLILEKK